MPQLGRGLGQLGASAESWHASTSPDGPSEKLAVRCEREVIGQRNPRLPVFAHGVRENGHGYVRVPACGKHRVGRPVTGLFTTPTRNHIVKGKQVGHVQELEGAVLVERGGKQSPKEPEAGVEALAP